MERHIEAPFESPILAEIRRARAGRAGIAAAVLAAAAQAQDGNQDKKWRHGLSLFGDLKYPEGFKQFDYVNANAPKGGTVRQIAIGTFDNFNLVVAGVKGTLAASVGLIYDTLLTSALDEVTGAMGCLPKR